MRSVLEPRNAYKSDSMTDTLISHWLYTAAIPQDAHHPRVHQWLELERLARLANKRDLVSPPHLFPLTNTGRDAFPPRLESGSFDPLRFRQIFTRRTQALLDLAGRLRRRSPRIALGPTSNHRTGIGRSDDGIVGPSRGCDDCGSRSSEGLEAAGSRKSLVFILDLWDALGYSLVGVFFQLASWGVCE